MPSPPVREVHYNSPAPYREEEQGWGIRNVFTPWRTTLSARYRNVDRNEGIERPALLHPKPSTDNLCEEEGSLEASRVTSAATSQANSRRNSWGATVQDSENAAEYPRSRLPYARVTSDIGLESMSGTRLARPAPPWVHNSRSSSPVASSLYLPGTGPGSPGGASMQSMASTPNVSVSSPVAFHALIHVFPAQPTGLGPLVPG